MLTGYGNGERNGVGVAQATIDHYYYYYRFKRKALTGWRW